MRPKIKRHLILEEMFETLVNVKYFIQLKKNMFKYEKLEMYDTMKRLGFNEAVEVHVSKYNTKVEEEKREKEVMMKKFAKGFHEEKKAQPSYSFPSNYVPKVHEVKKFKSIYNRKGNSTTLLVTDKVSGFYYFLIESSHLVKPKMLRGKDYTKTFVRATEVFNEIESQFNSQPTYEAPKVKSTPKSTRKPRKPKEDNVDISHVQKAMGIDPNASNKSNNSNDDLDDILDGLF